MAAFVLCIGFVIIYVKIEGQTIVRNPRAAKLQNSEKYSTLSWVVLRFQGDLNLYITIITLQSEKVFYGGQQPHFSKSPI